MKHKIVEEIISLYKENPKNLENFYSILNKNLLETKCQYKGIPLPMGSIPFICTKELELEFKYSSEVFTTILDKTLNLAIYEKEVKDYFDFTPPMGDWIKHEGKNAIGTALSRLDTIITEDNEIKYIEFNTDNPGGQGWNDVYGKVYYENPYINQFLNGKVEPPSKKVTHAVYETFLNHGKKFWGNEEFTTCFIDLKDSGVRLDADIVSEYFNQQGLRSINGDPTDLVYKDQKLYLGDEQVHVIHRGMQGIEFIELIEKAKGFLQGYMDDTILSINSFRAVLGSQKSIMVFLSDVKNHHYFTKEEVSVINKYLPWTKRLSENIIDDWEGGKIELTKLIKEKKDDLVLKPSTGSGGKGVLVGKFEKQQVWEEEVLKHLGDKNWTLQKYVNLPKINVPQLVDGKIKDVKKYYNISPFVFGGKFAGLLARYSDTPVINVECGGAIVPVYILLKVN